MGAKNSKKIAQSPSPPTNMTKGYGCDGPKEDLTLREFDMGPLGENEVEIHVTHCGVCHTDLAMKENGFGMTQYPIIPGHEIVGIAKYVGKNVTMIKPGMRVGVGWFKGVCNVCRFCEMSKDNVCADGSPLLMTKTGKNVVGGFAKAIRVAEDCAFPLPEGLPSAAAAPLFCGGITMYAPMVRYLKDYKEAKIAVAGLGGLGSMGVQIGKALGHKVTGLSRNEKKRDLAMKLGCDEYLPMNNATLVEKEQGTFDLVINTIPADIDFQQHLNLLGTLGTYCIVGVSNNDLVTKSTFLIFGQKQIVGSAVGSKAEVKDMLEFCAKHKIVPEIMERDFKEINEVLHDLEKHTPLGRYVLVNSEEDMQDVAMKDAEEEGESKRSPEVSQPKKDEESPEAAKSEEPEEAKNDGNVKEPEAKNDENVEEPEEIKEEEAVAEKSPEVVKEDIKAEEDPVKKEDADPEETQEEQNNTLENKIME